MSVHRLILLPSECSECPLPPFMPALSCGHCCIQIFPFKLKIPGAQNHQNRMKQMKVWFNILSANLQAGEKARAQGLLQDREQLVAGWRQPTSRVKKREMERQTDMAIKIQGVSLVCRGMRLQLLESMYVRTSFFFLKTGFYIVHAGLQL